MWLEHLGPLLTGLAGLITAVAGLFSVRARDVRRQLRTCRQRLREATEEAELYRRQALEALRHIFRLEQRLARAGMPVPKRPPDLTQ